MSGACGACASGYVRCVHLPRPKVAGVWPHVGSAASACKCMVRPFLCVEARVTPWAAREGTCILGIG